VIKGVGGSSMRLLRLKECGSVALVGGLGKGLETFGANISVWTDFDSTLGCLAEKDNSVSLHSSSKICALVLSSSAADRTVSSRASKALDSEAGSLDVFDSGIT
jgi:hypothetical protein